MAQHNNLGKLGELHAFNLLKEKGYKILEQNWRHKQREVDVIALQDKRLVIVEVKTRSSRKFGNPVESVTLTKQKFLIEAAEAYLEQNDFDYELRFDVIEAVQENNSFVINHIEEAFIPLVE